MPNTSQKLHSLADKKVDIKHSLDLLKDHKKAEEFGRQNRKK